MKLEKINENQIRCTLTKQDLEQHQLRLSELAYGTDKAKKLFRDMMHQAQIQFGFEAENMPIMIEAIPVNTDSIILIITKVEDPEELDTRFSKFAPFKEKGSADTLQFDGADDIIDIFQKLCEAKIKEISGPAPSTPDKKEEEGAEDAAVAESVNLIRVYTFTRFDDIISAAHGLNGFFQGTNTLYKNTSGDYFLVLHQSGYSPEDFNKICNILSEYGTGKNFSAAGEAHLKEHGEFITAKALQKLQEL